MVLTSEISLPKNLFTMKFMVVGYELKRGSSKNLFSKNALDNKRVTGRSPPTYEETKIRLRL